MKCIKKEGTNSSLAYFRLKIGEICEYSIKEGYYGYSDYHIVLHLSESQSYKLLHSFAKITENGYKISIFDFEDNFITMAEYREERINKILDDTKNIV